MCGARTAIAAGRDSCVEASANPTCASGAEMADGQGKVEGQPGGMPGIWQGASSEQGTSSEDEAGAWEEPVIPGIESLDPSIATGCTPPAACIPNASPPTTARWRANKPARSPANRRLRFIPQIYRQIQEPSRQRT